MAARLTVSRTSPNDVKQRQIIIRLDGEEFATLMYGETATREVAPGSHRLKFDNTWVWKNIDFQLDEGEHAKFDVINRAGKLTWWMVGILGAGPMYLTVQRQSS